MRKIRLIALGLLLCGGLSAGEAGAQPKKDQSGGMKVTNNEGLIQKAFTKAYGRAAVPGEVGRWMKTDLTRDELIVKLVELLKADAGAYELRKTVERSYQKSFGRGPTKREVDFWQTEAKAKGYGFEALNWNHDAWLKTAEADTERTALVVRNHMEVFGRVPTDAELSAWRVMLEKGETNYSEMRNWNLQQMLNPSMPSLLNELPQMIGRAFAGANLPQPDAAQTNTWKATVKNQALTFRQLVEILKKSPPASPAPAPAPPEPRPTSAEKPPLSPDLAAADIYFKEGHVVGIVKNIGDRDFHAKDAAVKDSFKRTVTLKRVVRVGASSYTEELGTRHIGDARVGETFNSAFPRPKHVPGAKGYTWVLTLGGEDPNAKNDTFTKVQTLTKID